MPTDPGSTPLWISFLPSIIGYILGAVTAVIAEPIRQRIFRPELALYFDDSPACLSLTKTRSEVQARYIRVKVFNTRRIIAKECRGYLIRIEKKNGNGDFIDTDYCDSIPLRWSCRLEADKFKPIAIPKGVNQFLDVIAVYQGARHIEPQLHVLPFRYEPIFHGTGVFRFTIQIIAEHAEPKIIRLIIEWNGVWSDIKVYKNKGI